MQCEKENAGWQRSLCPWSGEWQERKSRMSHTDQIRIVLQILPLTQWPGASYLTSQVLSFHISRRRNSDNSLIVRANIPPECTGMSYWQASILNAPPHNCFNRLLSIFTLTLDPRVFGVQSSWFSAWHILSSMCDPLSRNWVLQQY